MFLNLLKEEIDKIFIMLKRFKIFNEVVIKFEICFKIFVWT